MAATIALLGLALFVRTLEAPPPPPPPELESESGARIAQPLQLLRAGAPARLDELTGWISLERRTAWEASHREVFALSGCPGARAWLDTAHGQAFERLFASLRGGTREDAFAGLALAFQLARATHWKPGVFSGEGADAERLGSLLEDWLQSRAEAATQDALLYEPAVAACLLYGRVMRAAVEGPRFGTNQAARSRAERFLGELCGVGRGARSSFGDALFARHPRAFALLASGDRAALDGLADECAVFFPDLDGDCGR